MRVYCIGGSGSSSNGNQIRKNVECIARTVGVDGEFFSLTPFRLRTKLKKIADKENGEILPGEYVFVAKSLGAYRLFKHADALRSIFECTNNSISIVTIDPHSPFWRCGPMRPINATWLLNYQNIKTWNIFQRDRYPRGAVVIGAENIQAEHCDHSKIVISNEAAQAYTEAFEWVTSYLVNISRGRIIRNGGWQ